MEGPRVSGEGAPRKSGEGVPRKSGEGAPRKSGEGAPRKSGEGGIRGSDPNTFAAAPIPPPPPAGPGNALNERTYQEVEYLKRNLGPILVAALAEICIRRPADPIEYLGHWLLRWRYNEELKRRDVQNALEVVRRKTWTDKEGEDEGLLSEIAPAVPPQPDNFSEGFLPSHPYAAPGYGGPLSGEQLKTILTDPNQLGPEDVEHLELAGEDEGMHLSQDQKRPSRKSEKRQSQAEPPRGSQDKRASQAQDAKRPSQSEGKRPSQPAEANRPSQSAEAKRQSQAQPGARTSGEGKRGSLKQSGSGGQPPAQ